MTQNEFSIYLVPASFIVLNLVACLTALYACSLNQSLFNGSWNILYSLRDGYRSCHTYMVRVVYFYRKTTIDFSKTNLMLQFVEVNELGKCNLRIPPKFFEPNAYNTFTRDIGTIKFLLIKDTEFNPIEKIGISHDHHGHDLNVSVVDINNTNSNDGFLGSFEKCIKPLTLAEMEQEQMTLTTSQSNMVLEGEFAINHSVSPSNIVACLYLYINVVGYKMAHFLQAYVRDGSIKKNYPIYTSLEQVTLYSLSYFYLIFGICSIFFGLAKYLLNNKPSLRYNKILRFINAIIVFVGIGYSFKVIWLLDPDQLQFWLKDGNMVSHFNLYWSISMLFAMGIAIFYCCTFCTVCFVLISLVFED